MNQSLVVMEKPCPVCLESVPICDTVWPYPCAHSVCRSCEQHLLRSQNYACPECRAPPLCYRAQQAHLIQLHQRAHQPTERLLPAMRPLEESPSDAPLVAMSENPVHSPQLQTLATSALRFINAQLDAPATPFEPLPSSAGSHGIWRQDHGPDDRRGYG